MIPKKPCPALDTGWVPVSRLREALRESIHLARCFGGRRQVGKDHAPGKMQINGAAAE
jgi:hypothetical protein